MFSLLFQGERFVGISHSAMFVTSFAFFNSTWMEVIPRYSHAPPSKHLQISEDIFIVTICMKTTVLAAEWNSFFTCFTQRDQVYKEKKWRVGVKCSLHKNFLHGINESSGKDMGNEERFPDKWVENVRKQGLNTAPNQVLLKYWWSLPTVVVRRLFL